MENKSIKISFSKYRIDKLIDGLQSIGIKCPRKEDLLMIDKLVEGPLFLVFDMNGIYGEVGLVKESNARILVDDINKFLELAKIPTKYPIINIDSDFRKELMDLNVGDFAVLKKYRDDPDSNEHVFIRVSKQTDNHFELYDDAFDGAALWGCVKNGFDDPIYKNDSVYYPVQW